MKKWSSGDVEHRREEKQWSGRAVEQSISAVLDQCIIWSRALQRNFDLYISRIGTARPQSQFPFVCL
jgi:hypothetical protein